MKSRFVVGFLALLVLATSSCVSRRADEHLARFEYQQAEMGLPFRMVLYAPDETAAAVAVAAAFKRISQINDVMSDYDEDSELSRLSRSSGSGKEVPVSDDLWHVLTRAQALAKRSDGAFDITVGPCVVLWRKARREHKMPDADLLAQSRRAVGYQFLQLNSNRRTAKLLVPHMRLDLGGIAKGFAVDEALKVLHQHGIKRALVAGGGDMAMSNPPPGKKGWRIELPPLDAPDAPPTEFVLLSNAALATSGDLFQRLEIDGKRYSHIVDPHTGIGLTDHSLVIVITGHCMTSDSLTKVVSVLGPEKGLRFIQSTPGAKARIVRKPGTNVELFESADFSHYFDRN